jgi:uncharacterized protein YceK
MQLILFHRSGFVVLLFLLAFIMLSGCYTYRLQTHAQAGSEVTTVNASSYLWGILQSPKGGITTPLCDSLDVNGVSVVRVRTNLGYALITVVTLGIWCPMKIDYRCSKPCQIHGHL